MDNNNIQEFDQLFQSAPGGIAKLAFDDLLTILFATDTFYSLIKSASEKVITNAPSALLKMVYSADMILVNQQLAAQRQRKDNLINIYFRTLQHDGSFKWVMITGNKTEETYLSGSRTVPVYSCIATDITYHMINYKRLEQINEYHSTISELSKDLFFEYVIATDTISFTQLFREVFGKDSILPGFRSRLEKTKMIHPEEHPAVVAIFNSMMNGKKQVRFEFRLITKAGVPSWYICYASIIFDENRNPYKVVGKLSTTNHMEKQPEKPVYKTQTDTLTGVYAKESAEQLITEAAAQQDSNSVSALLLIEVRNYKYLNDIRKSINGNNVLATVGEQIKTCFRTTDITGRLGLSEFIVYMKDIYSDQAAYEAAEHLCNAVERIYSYSYNKNSVSISIGVAFHRGKQEYKTILAKANTALVMAKKVSNSSFEVFNGSNS